MMEGWEAAGRDDPALLELFNESIRWDWESYLQQYWPASQAPWTTTNTLLIEDSLVSCHLGAIRVDASPWALLLFAVHLLHHDAPGPAIVVLEQIRPAVPQTPLILIHLATAYKDLADTTTDPQLVRAAAARAVTFFHQCLVFNLRWAIIYRHLGDIYRLLGDKERAIACWRQYLELEPAGVMSDMVRAQIAALSPMSGQASANNRHNCA
jgi:tetratricopeptide (TPR) repeat protein